MCLFKRDEQENNCVHEECKNYYLLNKQICMYSKQNQEVKRAKPNEEQNFLELLQKKIKKETDLKPYTESSTQSAFSQSFTLNPVMLTQKNQATSKSEIPSSSGIFFPLLSQQQNIQQSLHTPVPETTNPMNFSNMSLAQLINLRNQNNMTNAAKSNETKAVTENSQSNDSSIKDFQSKLLNLVLSQNKMLVELKEKNDLIQDTMSCLVSEVSSLKKCIKPPTAETVPTSSGNSSLFTQIIGNTADTINTDGLLTYLYGPNPEFQYQLVLKQELSLPLYRERNFKFTVMLVDRNGKTIENTNRIPLSIGIYSSENPPKYIDSNTSGNKILKGFIEKDLVYGTATFEKIQIKEVTSHFRNGWIFFVVYPKNVAGGNMVTVDGNLNFVSSQKIKPLVLEKVVVKAKKSKEKDNAAEAEENAQDEMEQEKEEAVFSNNTA